MSALTDTTVHDIYTSKFPKIWVDITLGVYYMFFVFQMHYMYVNICYFLSSLLCSDIYSEDEQSGIAWDSSSYYLSNGAWQWTLPDKNVLGGKPCSTDSSQYNENSFWISIHYIDQSKLTILLAHSHCPHQCLVATSACHHLLAVQCPLLTWNASLSVIRAILFIKEATASESYMASNSATMYQFSYTISQSIV